MTMTDVQIYTRMSTETLWFHETWLPYHEQYMKTNYEDTNKFSGTKELSSDGLILTLTYNFLNEDAMNEFSQDTYLQGMAEQRLSYNEANDITRIG